MENSKTSYLRWYHLQFFAVFLSPMLFRIFLTVFQVIPFPTGCQSTRSGTFFSFAGNRLPELTNTNGFPYKSQLNPVTCQFIPFSQPPDFVKGLVLFQINEQNMALFISENPPISPDELKEFETATGLSLPGDYRTHMLKYNGGSPSSIYVFFGVPDDGINLFGFYPIKYGTSLFAERKNYLPEKYIGIGRTGTGYLAMSLDEGTHGNIFVHYSEVKLQFLASSFTEFLEGLTDYTVDFERSPGLEF